MKGDLQPRLIVMVLYTPGSTSEFDTTPPDEGKIKYHFLGGGDEVGNVGCIIEDEFGSRLLIDYGFVPKNPPTFPEESPEVSDVILTHSHIDHIGLAPWVVASHGATIHCTEMTAALLEMLWRDTYKVSSIEKQPLPWDKRDLEEALDNIVTHKFGEWHTTGKMRWRFHSAGHIPGAAMIEIETASKKILWTGDFDTRDSPCTSGAKPIEADVLFVETTYAGRTQPDRGEEVNRFLDRVVEIVEGGGVALIPAFANGRGQDILMHLWNSELDLNVHFDGMGKRIMNHFLENSDYISDPEKLREVKRWARLVSSKSDRKKALSADVIVTTSGMLDGGPALWYLNRLRNDQRNGILLTGYQAEGSGGRMLLDEARLKIFSNIVDINLQVDQFSFSTHASQPEIADFIKEVSPQDVVFFHGNRDEGQEMLKGVCEESSIKVHQPVNRRTYTI